MTPQLALPVPSDRRVVVVTLAVRTVNPNNQSRGHSQRTAIIRSRQDSHNRQMTYTLVLKAIRDAGYSRVDLVPAVVTLTRISAGHCDDDGLAGALKRIQDGVADALGINDGGRLVKWTRLQRKGPRKEHFVEVRIERAGS